MKKTIVAVLLLCAGLFTACDELIYINGYRPLPELSIDPAWLDVPAEGDSAITIRFIINEYIEGAEVTAEEKCEWFVLKALTDNHAIVAVAPNPADTARFGQILFSYNGEEQACLTAHQYGME